MPDKPIRVRRFADLLNKPVPRIHDGHRWGPWRLDAETRELVFQGPGKYSIPLDGIIDAAELVDWIFHMKEKEAFVTDEVMGHLLSAIRDLFQPLIHGGKRKINPREHIERLLNLPA